MPISQSILDELKRRLEIAGIATMKVVSRMQLELGSDHFVYAELLEPSDTNRAKAREVKDRYAGEIGEDFGMVMNMTLPE